MLESSTAPSSRGGQITFLAAPYSAGTYSYSAHTVCVQDLERQVRLRLGLGLQGRRPKEKAINKAEGSSQITFSHLHHTRHPNFSHRHELECQTRHEQHTSSPRDEEDKKGSEVMERAKERAQREERKKVRNSEQSSGNQLGDKLELFHYISR